MLEKKQPTAGDSGFFGVFVRTSISSGGFMSGRLFGTVVTGLRAPIFKKGDDMVKGVSDTLSNFLKSAGMEPGTKDVLAVTESVVARAQGNYVSVDDIAQDIKGKYGEDTIGLIFPILSRNRFATALKGIARGCAKKIVLMLSYPSDEVGNHLVWISRVDEKGVNPWKDTLREAEFRNHFGYEKHTFTGVDYIEYYKEIVQSEGKECEIIFSNNPLTVLDYTKSVLMCDIHSAERTEKRLLKAGGVKKLYGLRHICSEPTEERGYNVDYGLLGSNKADEERLKLFPRDCHALVREIQAELLKRHGKKIEVMVFGDGAFKDPVGKIWELADPVVSPGFTDGLSGTPHELKLKYIADNVFPDLSGDALKDAVKKYIEDKKSGSGKDAMGKDAMDSQGTTPRQITDLLGSLCDLTSGSGDKGTPIIYIRGYFDNITSE